VDAFGRFKKTYGFVLSVVISIANLSQKDLTDQRPKA